MPPVPPANFFRLKVIRFFRGGDRRTDIFVYGRQPPLLRKRLRQQRRSLRTRSQHCRTGGQTKSNFYEVAAFHDVSSSSMASRVMRGEFECVEMNGR
jgi:hypothetical protein